MNSHVLDEGNSIITVTRVLSSLECESLIGIAESQGFTDAPITTALGFAHRPDIRNNTRVMLDDAKLAGRLWARVRQAVPEQLLGWQAVGLNERLRFYLYEVGQAFRWHYDGSFRRSALEQSQLTLLIGLNGGFVGGATMFKVGHIVAPRQGMALLFRHPDPPSRGGRAAGAQVRTAQRYHVSARGLGPLRLR